MSSSNLKSTTNKEETILITGGTGYIGSHTVVELMNKGKKVIIIDNLSNSQLNVIDNIKKITGTKPLFYNIDLRNINELEKIFYKNKIDSVIHFAGLKSVSESIKKPDLYHENNVIGTESLIKCMFKYDVQKLIFSSSATVYGEPQYLPINESHVLNPLNPYGQSKLEAENIIFDYISKSKKLSCIALRYFNPIGAHPSGLIGENKLGTPTNIMPLICMAASKEIEFFEILGNDYPSYDGTGIRDYIHIYDLVAAHLCSLNYLSTYKGFLPINIGTGRGYSVLELIEKFKSVNNVIVPYKFSKRRLGDSSEVYSDNAKAINVLKWIPIKDLDDMVRDSWKWGA